jgi:glycosyltransferase involved in cell wall biosynthesis
VGVDVEVVVPVYNEAHQVEGHITKLRAFLDDQFPYRALITVVDNASTDATLARVTALAATTPDLSVIHLDRKGRGGAIRTAWSASEAAVVAYMDVDLSTDLRALLPLVRPLLEGEKDLAIGSRRLPGSRVRRGAKRETISRAYLALARIGLGTRISDLQCGFKAMRADAARDLLPDVEDNEWFFDTELLVLAERRGLRIVEVPVTWVDDPDTRVRIFETAAKDIQGILRLRRRGGQHHGTKRR